MNLTFSQKKQFQRNSFACKRTEWNKTLFLCLENRKTPIWVELKETNPSTPPVKSPMHTGSLCPCHVQAVTLLTEMIKEKKKTYEKIRRSIMDSNSNTLIQIQCNAVWKYPTAISLNDLQMGLSSNYWKMLSFRK